MYTGIDTLVIQEFLVAKKEKNAPKLGEIRMCAIVRPTSSSSKKQLKEDKEM